VLSPRYKTVLELGLPIMGAMVSQNVMNVVDTLMVGTQGPHALDAVGMSSMVVFLAQAFIMGLSSGVQAMSARRLGENRLDRMAVPLNGGLGLAILFGLPLALALYWAAPDLYPYLRADPLVVAEGVPYLRSRLVAVVAVGMNFAFRGYFNGTNQPKIYMRSLVVMHVSDVVISYVLVFGKLGFPVMGATGAGIGTSAGTFVATGMYFVMAWRRARSAGFLSGMPRGLELRRLFEQSWPSGVRQAFFAAGLTALFWIVGQLGSAAGAAANILVTLMLLAILPAMGLGMAAASLVGQALGRRDVDDARRWGWDVVRVALVILVLIGAPMVLFPSAILGVFTRDAATIEAGRIPLMLVGGTMFLDAVGLVLQNAMLGAGDSRRVMVVAIALQWVLLLPAAYVIGPLLGLGLAGVWLAQCGHRLVQALCFWVLWRDSKWAAVEI
jgi:putative MATE family efflux protein